MLKDRIKQFRIYNNLEPRILADTLNLPLKEYESFEKGTLTPGIEIIKQLAAIYKVTLDEFYGYTPRLTLQSDNPLFEDDTPVEERILRMSDLSWDEAQLILYYRKRGSDDELIKKIIECNSENE